jgi:O-antigen ligase
MSLAVFPLWLYLTGLMLAPQLWWGPMLDWRVDLFILPVWAVALLVKGRLGGFFNFRTQDKFMGLFVLWVFLSVAINGVTYIFDYLFLTYFKWFIVFRFLVLSITTPKELKQAGGVFLFFGLLLALQSMQHMTSADALGWAGQTFGWVDPAAASIGLDKRTRWVGIFDGPGVFAVIFTTALPFAVQYVARTYNALTRLTAAFVLVPMLLLGLYYTGSRGGMLAGASIVGMYVLTKVRLSVPKLMGVAILGAATLMLAPSYLTDTRDSSGSAQHRISMWAEGIEMVQQNPVFGIGRKQFGRYTGSLIAHNSAVEIMGETGVPGFFFWIGVIYLGLRNLYIRGRETDDPKERALLLALGISVLGYCAGSMFVTLEYDTFYILLGLTSAVANWTGAGIRVQWPDLRRIAAIILGFMLALKLYVMSYN